MQDDVLDIAALMSKYSVVRLHMVLPKPGRKKNTSTKTKNASNALKIHVGKFNIVVELVSA